MFLTPGVQITARNLRSILNTSEKFMESIPVNVEYNSKEYIYKAILPGFNREEIKVSVEEGQLRVLAEKKEVEKVEGQEENVKHSSAWNIVSQQAYLSIPRLADFDNISLKLENGILTIVLPKKVPDVKLLEIK